MDIKAGVSMVNWLICLAIQDVTGISTNRQDIVAYIAQFDIVSSLHKADDVHFITYVVVVQLKYCFD